MRGKLFFILVVLILAVLAGLFTSCAPAIVPGATPIPPITQKFSDEGVKIEMFQGAGGYFYRVIDTKNKVLCWAKYGSDAGISCVNIP